PAAFAALFVRTMQEGRKLKVIVGYEDDLDDLDDEDGGLRGPDSPAAQAAREDVRKCLDAVAGKAGDAERPAPPNGHPDPARFASLPDGELRQRLGGRVRRRRRGQSRKGR